MEDIISKEDYLLNKIIERIKRIKGNKEGKKNRIKFYRDNKERLKNLCLVDIHDFNFEREVKFIQAKYDKIRTLEIERFTHGR